MHQFVIVFGETSLTSPFLLLFGIIGELSFCDEYFRLKLFVISLGFNASLDIPHMQ